MYKLPRGIKEVQHTKEFRSKDAFEILLNAESVLVSNSGYAASHFWVSEDIYLGLFTNPLLRRMLLVDRALKITPVKNLAHIYASYIPSDDSGWIVEDTFVGYPAQHLKENPSHCIALAEGVA